MLQTEMRQYDCIVTT